jgi:hypothetical protein
MAANLPSESVHILGELQYLEQRNTSPFSSQPIIDQRSNLVRDAQTARSGPTADAADADAGVQ